MGRNEIAWLLCAAGVMGWLFFTGELKGINWWVIAKVVGAGFLIAFIWTILRRRSSK
jgi:hypothetical protein